MFKPLLLFVLILNTSLNYGQGDKAVMDSVIASYVNTVKEDGATSVFSMKQYCDGEVRMFVLKDGSRCTSKGTYIEAFVFYKKDDVTRISKMDNCGAFAEQTLADNSLMEYYDSNVAAIQNKKVKPFETAMPNEQPKSRTAVYRCHRDFVFYGASGELTSNYSLYQLSNDGDQPNLNYQYNNALEVVSLEAKIQEQLAQIATQGGFKRK